jgi:pimeloyl-ACP methyl ester carboxylesterase
MNQLSCAVEASQAPRQTQGASGNAGANSGTGGVKSNEPATSGGAAGSSGSTSGGQAGDATGGITNGGRAGTAGAPGENVDDCVPSNALPDPTLGKEFSVGISSYQGQSIRLGTAPARYEVEVKATVFYPATRAGNDTAVAGTKAYPVIVMMHGMHSIFRDRDGEMLGCYLGFVAKTPFPHVMSLSEVQKRYPGAKVLPNNLGYTFLAENLAAAGYVFVSIDANTSNCLNPDSPDAFTPERAELMREHVKQLKSVGTLAGMTHLGGRLDLDKLVYAGHSRGGEGAILAAAAGDVPGTKVRGVIAVAPTSWRQKDDFTRPDSLKIDASLLTLLGAADGDVSDNGGMTYYDVAAPNSGTDSNWFKAQQYIHGANHNFFNSEWHDLYHSNSVPYPGGDNGIGNGENRLSRKRQEQYLVTITRTFLAALFDSNAVAREALSGNALITGLEDMVVASSFQTAHPKQSLSGAKASGSGKISLHTFTASPNAYNRTFFHETSGYVATWEGAPAAFNLPVTSGSDAKQVTFRAAQIWDSRNEAGRSVDLDVELIDESGKTVQAASDWAGSRILPWYVRPEEGKTVLGSVKIPLACFQGDGSFDRSKIRTLRIKPRESRGALALTEFQIF